MASTSHLTRAVFRAIINNRPYIAAECRRIPQQTLARNIRYVVPHIQKRTRMFGAIFNTLDRGFEGAKNTPKNLEIALGRLVEFVRARRSHSRGPTDEETLDAFKFLLYSRSDSQSRLTRNEVYLATEVFKHFQEKGLSAENVDKSLMTRDDLDTILKALALPSEKEKFRSDTKSLAAMVYAALPSRAEQQVGVFQESAALLPVYVTILARTGAALDALRILRGSAGSGIQDNVRVWVEILKGLAGEGRSKEFNQVMQEMHDRMQTLHVTDYEDLMLFLAENENFNEARRVYEQQVTNQINMSTIELQALLELCARTGQSQYGRSVAQALESRIDEDGVLGSLLVWAGTESKTPEDLKREIGRLLDLNPSDGSSMTPFNRLIEVSYKSDRPAMATATLEFVESIGLEPDGKSYALRLQHAIQQQDLTAAAEMYENMTRQDYSSDNTDIISLNKFVTALAFSPDSDYNLLMRVIDTLLERNADFDAEALAGVCRVLLQRDELEDLTGLLRHRVDFYPSADRERISRVFEEFVRDMSVKDQRAYNAYDVFRTAFPETLPERRVPLMQSFFNRKRPDLGCLVFGHMRQKEEAQTRPDSNTYAKCFEGIAQCRDIDGLQMVYNMLKLDLEVELTTKVRNSLMLAYIACQMPYTAMIDHFWKIMDSREGPTYSTFEIALRACESWIPQGGYEARKVMAIVQAWNLEITKDLYDCYVGAIAGQSEFENVVELIEEMENETGERPDVYTIGAFYNAIPWQYRKDEVEKWAKKTYPDLWEELASFGDEIDEEWEIRYFHIDRTIDIEDPPLFADGKYDAQISRDAVQALEPPPEKTQPAENSIL